MRFIKRLGQGLIGLGLVSMVALGGSYGWSQMRMDRRYEVNPVPVAVPADPATLDHGAHIAAIRGCTDCHGKDLSGGVFMDEMPVARLSASNLTRGVGGVAGAYRTDPDWVRAIRDGVGPDGKPLLFMPSDEFRSMGPRDMGALVAYLKSLPPVDRELPRAAVGPVGRVLFLTGAFPLLAAERIDHEDRTFSQPVAAVTPEFGAYVASACVGCHGETFAGGAIPGVPPTWPHAANLTPHPAAPFASWSQEDLRRFADTGLRPDGRQVESGYMPWPVLAALSETEFQALWSYLRSLPPRASAE